MIYEQQLKKWRESSSRFIFSPKTFKIINGDETITVIIIDLGLLRSGTIYYVIQHSAQGLRYLVYLTKYKYHPKATDKIDIPSDEELVQKYERYLLENKLFNEMIDAKVTLHI